MRFIDTLTSRCARPVDFNKVDFPVSVVAKNFGLKLVYLYGSYALDTASKLSDIDIGYLSYEKFTSDKCSRLLEEFQRIFEEEAVDLVDLRNAPLTLLHRIFKNGKCLYAASLSERIDFEVNKENLYLDAAPIRLEYGQALMRRINDGSFGH